MSTPATRLFFDGMARTYDADLIEIDWNPCALVERWGFAVPDDARVLDAGCGTGQLLAWYVADGRTLKGFDMSPKMLAQARRRPSLQDVELVQGDASQRWPAADASVDVLFSFGMLEFVPRPEHALAEIERILAPGGRALISFEDRVDWEGSEREAMELRYDFFPLWRHWRHELEAAVPSGLHVRRWERCRAYRMTERGFTTAYHVIELERSR